ncbi:family 43 glycosylhydrolase [Metabacillus litoralis]|uniref:Family 43 glycosylhydrolase n=1 Tax=Metabacillus litoralis TaxID=152268 RepID=A0A5C6W0E0_9BACI|nr:immunoglobulin-like domain-containing protein [Metabacillus litoralis]TXC91339.1 family 43 glycosylhydrolase [Metabacillus litoralis]
MKKQRKRKFLPLITSLVMVCAVLPGTTTITKVNAASNAEKILDYDMSNINGTTVVDSAGQFDGTLVNPDGVDLITNEDTKVVNFEGGDTASYIEIPNGVLDGLDSVTVSSLVNWEGSGGAQWLYGLGQDDTHYVYYTPSYIGGATDRLGIATDAWRNETFAASPKLPATEWKLVTTVINGAEEKLETYIDGKLVATGSTNGFTLDDIKNTEGISGFIAKSFYAPDPYFGGMVADFEIFGGALTAQDVSVLYSEAEKKIDAIGGLDGYFVNFAINQLDASSFLKYNENESGIITDLQLPEKGAYETTITWQSNNQDIISNEGKVTRPLYSEGDQTVVLTATVTDGKTLQTKEFTLKVLKGLEESVALQEDADALKIHHASDVRGNLPLPNKGENGSTISWETSDSNVVTTTGEVNRPEHGKGDVTVELKATLSLNGQSVVKNFTVSVTEMPVKDEDYAAYLMTYFNGEAYADGEQVRFALSDGNDVTEWNEINNGDPVLTSNLGEKGLRDPSIIRSPEGDKFYLLATDLKVYGTNGNWGRTVREGSNSLMIWESTDLVNWSEQRMVEITSPETGNTWAPEVYYDDSTGEYIVYWSSFVYDSVADRYGNGASHNRIMYAKTRDFYTFTEPETLLDLGHDILDTVAIDYKDKVYRITKGTYYTEKELAGEEIREHVFQEVGDSFFGDFELTKEGIGMDVLDHGEGAEIFQSNTDEDKFYLLIDEYGNGRGYTLFETNDIASADWKLSEDINLPDRPRHGDVLSLTKKEFERLKINIPGVGVEVIEPGDGEEPPTDGEEPPTDGEEPPTDGEEPPTDGEEPPTDGEEPPTDGEEPPTNGEEPPTDGEEPPTDGEEPPTDGEEPPTDGEEPPTDGEEPPTDGEEPPTDGVEKPSNGEESPSKEEKPQSGNLLPATATSLYNYLVIGLVLLVIGGFTAFRARRKLNL